MAEWAGTEGRLIIHEFKDGYSTEEVPGLIRRLNRTYPEPLQWTSKRAQKEHVDLFGRLVKSGETYWRMTMEGGYSDDLKMSEISMERFLFALFAPHSIGELEAAAMEQEEIQRVRDIMDRLRPARTR